MSAESLKIPQPGETTSPGGLILPPERKSNVRETTSYDNLAYRSDKYNSPGVDPENPYNAFAPTRIEVTVGDSQEQEPQPQSPERTAEAHTEVLEKLVTELQAEREHREKLQARIDELEKRLAGVGEAKKELADKQPRRVRHENGVTERLVKYADGSFAWEVISANDDAEQPDVADTEHGQVAWELTSASAVEVEQENAETAVGAETANDRLEVNIGDTVRYFDREGKLIEGEVISIIELDNEDYQIYRIQTPDGKKPYVSYAEIVQGEGALTPETGSDEAEDEEAKKNGNERNIDDIVFPEVGEKKEGDKWTPEISDELQTKLQEAIDKYAEATAKNRNGYLGHFLHNSKFLVKIPLIGKLLKGAADKLNAVQDKALLGPARAEYRQAMLDIQRDIEVQVKTEFDGKLEEAEILEKQRNLANDAAIQAEVALELKIAGSRMELSGKTNKLVNWWVRHDGLGGKFAKAGIVAGAGLTAGALIGLAGAPIVLGSVVGAGIGASVGAYMTKKRSAGITSKGGSETLAQKQGQEDISRKAAYAKGQTEGDAFADVDELINQTEDRTGNEKVGNRRRTKGLAGLGAAAGGLGAGIGSAIRQGIENGAGSAEPRIKGEAEGHVELPSDVPQYDNISILDNEGGTEAIERLFNATPDQARTIWDTVFNQYGTSPLDHTSVGTPGGMPDIMQLSNGSYGWSHEGWLSTDMTNALNQAAKSVIG